MKNNLYLFLLITSFIFFILLDSAFAQTSYFRISDRIGNVLLPTVNTNDTVSLDVTSGSSYCCEILHQSGNIKFTSTTVQINHFSGSTTATGRHAGFDEPVMPDLFDRLCFITPPALDAPRARMTFTSLAGAVSNVPVQCAETTLYGGFNTSVTDFNFLELTNTLSKRFSSDEKTISGKVTAINTVPNPDTTVINNASFSVNAESRLDLDIHQAAGIGAFGPIKVAHNAAPGALKGIVSQYNVTSTSPLDFAPVAQDVLQTRANLSGVKK